VARLRLLIISDLPKKAHGSLLPDLALVLLCAIGLPLRVLRRVPLSVVTRVLLAVVVRALLIVLLRDLLIVALRVLLAAVRPLPFSYDPLGGARGRRLDLLLLFFLLLNLRSLFFPFLPLVCRFRFLALGISIWLM